MALNLDVGVTRLAARRLPKCSTECSHSSADGFSLSRIGGAFPGDRSAFGIWLGPACVHMPSGNMVVQFATPRGGPFDPAPVFTYNSQASISNLRRGYGVLDLFHPTVEQWRDVTSLITGTGRYLEYTGVGEGTWCTALASTRRGVFDWMAPASAPASFRKIAEPSCFPWSAAACCRFGEGRLLPNQRFRGLLECSRLWFTAGCELESGSRLQQSMRRLCSVVRDSPGSISMV